MRAPIVIAAFCVASAHAFIGASLRPGGSVTSQSHSCAQRVSDTRSTWDFYCTNVRRLPPMCSKL